MVRWRSGWVRGAAGAAGPWALERWGVRTVRCSGAGAFGAWGGGNARRRCDNGVRALGRRGVGVLEPTSLNMYAPVYAPVV